VVRAEKLAGKDFSAPGRATSDPYVQIKVGTNYWQTPTIKKTCDPAWTQDNVHDFVVYSMEQVVFIDCLDWDYLSADDPLGSVLVHNDGIGKRITVRELWRLSQDGPTPFRLYAASDKEEPPPEESRVVLEVDWLHLQHPLVGPTLGPPDARSSRYVVTLKVDECRGLPESGLARPSRSGWAPRAPRSRRSRMPAGASGGLCRCEHCCYLAPAAAAAAPAMRGSAKLAAIGATAVAAALSYAAFASQAADVDVPIGLHGLHFSFTAGHTRL